VSTRPIAVLDASVLVPYWSRIVLQRLAASEPPRFDAVWSTAIVGETWRVLTEQRLHGGDSPSTISRDAHRMWSWLDPVLRVVECSRCPPGTPPSPLSDPNDTHLWYAAINAGAGYVVSHNTRDFPPAVPAEPATASPRAMRHLSHGVEFLTAIEFIEDVLGEDAAALYGRPLPAGVVRSRRTPRIEPFTGAG
jgi:hypothetical protein